MAFLLLLLCTQYWILNVFGCELFHPQAIRVKDGDTLRMRSTYLTTLIYEQSNCNQLLVNMTGRAFCVNDICSIPGPTLIIHPGMTVYIQLENDFDVNYVDISDEHGPDIINIHSHGLHISGLEDNVFDTIHPSQSKLVTWTIHPQHHIGTNWYHAHHHTSTDITVHSGMYGALIVDKKKNKKLNYNKPNKINDYIIQISWQYLIDNKYCGNCVNYSLNTGAFNYRDSFKLLGSSCSAWCGFSETQRSNSGYVYDVKLDGSENMINDETKVDAFEVFLVNNQYQPTLSKLKSNTYFKLRFITSSASAYVQFEFDYNNETQCEYSLIARDGIALQDIDRDLSEKPYFGQFLLPPGGRIDVLVFCKGDGVATIYHNELHPYYPGINESYPMGRMGRQILLKLDIEESKDKNECKKSKMIKSIQQLTYPEPTNGFPYYLQELIDSNDPYNNNEEIEDECLCSNYNRNRTEDLIVKNTNKCGLELVEGIFGEHGNGVQDLFEVNGISFNTSDPKAIYMISLNKMYEFYLNTDGHPFHIHVNPFMVQQDLLDGYIAQKYDMMDVLGFNFPNDSARSINGDDPENQGFLIRYNARDYVGNVILHCHFLSHEDLGMMSYMKIVDDVTDDLSYCQNEYGFGYSDKEEDFHKNTICGNNLNSGSYGTIQCVNDDSCCDGFKCYTATGECKLIEKSVEFEGIMSKINDIYGNDNNEDNNDKSYTLFLGAISILIAINVFIFGFICCCCYRRISNSAKPYKYVSDLDEMDVSDLEDERGLNIHQNN